MRVAAMSENAGWPRWLARKFRRLFQFFAGKSRRKNWSAFFEACLPAGCHPKIFAGETLDRPGANL